MHVPLLVLLSIDNALCNILAGGAYAADGKVYIVVEEVAGEHLDLAREGGTVHERLALSFGWHALLLHNAADLGLEAHIQHAISLVEHKEPAHL